MREMDYLRAEIDGSMFFHWFSFVLFFLSFGLGGAAKRAWALEFQAVSPEELKITTEPKAPGAPAVILFRQVDRDDSVHELRQRFGPWYVTGSGHEDVYLRLKILTEEGRKYANIEIPYKEGETTVTNIHARSIKPDGAVVNFEDKIFDKTIVKAKGTKYLAKSFTLPDVQVGGIIEYFYTINLNHRLIFESHWILSEELFTKRAKFSLQPSIGWELRWTYHDLPLGVKPTITPQRTVVLEVNDIPAFQEEDFMPPADELKTRVDFIYSSKGDTFADDPDNYWKQFGKQNNDALEAFIGKGRSMQDAVATIISSADSPEQKLRKIYARVQQLHNISFETDKTVQEKKRAKEKWPKNVDEVWKFQRGNDVQLTFLFVALARAAGCEAYAVWVADRSNYRFSPRIMDGRWLLTTVALLKVNGEDLYLDPGSEFAPFGMLSLSKTGVSGYRLDKDGGGWVKTTLPASSQSQIERKAELKLTDTNDLEGKLTVTYTGLECSARRFDKRFADDAERKKFLEDEVEEWIPTVSQAELTNQPDWKSSSSSMIGEFALKVTQWASPIGRRIVLPVGLFGATEKHVFDHAERVHPIYFEFPFERIDDVSIELPVGWQIASAPASKRKDARLVFYSVQAVNHKDTVQLHRTLKVDSAMIDPMDYSVLRNFFQELRSADEQLLMLEPENNGAVFMKNPRSVYSFSPVANSVSQVCPIISMRQPDCQ